MSRSNLSFESKDGGARLEYARDNGQAILRICGRLDSEATTRIWRETRSIPSPAAGESLIIDGSKLDYCDSAGIALIAEIDGRWRDGGGDTELREFPDDVSRLLQLAPLDSLRIMPPAPPRKLSLISDTGRATAGLASDIVEMIAYIGELTSALFRALSRPRKLRWGDALEIAEQAGANAIPIILLIGFLMGLIMAFQSIIPMHQFGADIFVADLVALSMIRELGPLLTAILLAGRTGSAFAAELGTMKVNEEIDALTTMGLEPMHFLVAPRVLAAVFVTPLLTLFANLAGLIGGLVVFLMFEFPMVTYWNRVMSIITMTDLAGGLVKATVFGLLVAGVGCMRGLQTESGASAVGVSATRAVVSGIVLIAIADGVFAIAYNILGI